GNVSFPLGNEGTSYFSGPRFDFRYPLVSWQYFINTEPLPERDPAMDTLMGVQPNSIPRSEPSPIDTWTPGTPTREGGWTGRPPSPLPSLQFDSWPGNTGLPGDTGTDIRGILGSPNSVMLGFGTPSGVEGITFASPGLGSPTGVPGFTFYNGPGLLFG